ncbi:MAG: hypothetical protein PHD09_00035 [Candidatus Omnitrophica bacterium]|nr:hypothetical protein [Candidatus Omnitrophota bacterium]
MFKISDRPINYIFLMLQGKLIGENSTLALILLFLSVLFIAFGFYYLVFQLFNDSFTAFIGALLFSILPNVLEIYHSLIFLNMNTAIGIYIFSTGFFIKFINSKKKAFLYLSFFSYLLVIFWYEVGFFEPFVLMAYCFCLKRNNLIKYLVPFFAAEIIYLACRFYIMPVLNQSVSQHAFSLTGVPLAFVELLHHYAGRYLLRSLIYGFYLFFVLVPKWLFFVFLIFDIAALYILKKLLKDNRLKISGKQILFAIAAAIFFIAPLFLSRSGGIGGRHLVLPSIGIVILAIWWFSKLGSFWKPLLLVITGLFLIVSQGNSWAQVVSCRINRAIYDSLKANKDKLLASQRIVFDNKSFSDKIKFTFVERDFNLLNTYFGAQALEDRGLVSMVNLAVDHIDKPVFVAKGPLNFTPDGQVNFEVIAQENYRRIRKAMVSLPQEGTLVIGFNDIFKADHNYGFIKNER